MAQAVEGYLAVAFRSKAEAERFSLQGTSGLPRKVPWTSI
jgi:hypothetical protein